MYITFNYDLYSRLNPRLYNIVTENFLSSPVRGGALRTDFDLHQRQLKDIDILLRWVRNILPQACYYFSQLEDSPAKALDLPYDMNFFEVVDCWGIHYNKGQSVIKHNHFPYSLSFCYYVKVPRGSSPLILEGKRIKPIEGQIILFPAYQYHSSPKSKVDGRCAITGNILYYPHGEHMLGGGGGGS